MIFEPWRPIVIRMPDLGCWCEPEGWRRWYCIAIAILVFPFVLPPVAVEVAGEWPRLDAWQRARVVLVSIYMLIFAALWCWGVWSIACG